MADNYGIVPASSPSTYIKSKEVSAGVHSPQIIPSDSSGAPYAAGNPFPVTATQSGTWTVNLGTLNGAATAAAQGTGNASLSSIDTKTPALVSGRVPVDGSGVIQPISASALPLPSGAATSAAQTTGNTSLASLDTKVPAKGAATTANSTPVTIATDQAAVAVDTVVRASSVDRGGTITTGGTAQQFMAANANRRGVLIQNQSTGDLYVNFVATAAANQTSLRIPAGALYETGPHHAGTGAGSIIGATTGQAYYAREF